MEVENAMRIGQYLENGGDPNVFTGDKISLLGGCIQGGNMEGVRLLLEAGANPNAPSTEYLTRSRFYTDLISYYEYGETTELLHLLFRVQDRSRPIFDCMNNDASEILELLVRHGADIHQTCWGLTGLHYTCLVGAEQSLLQLLDAGAQIDEPCGESGLTPLHLAILFKQSYCSTTLLEEGANAQSVDSAGRTPLHVAARMSRLLDVMQLLVHGARVDAVDARGDQPLQVAVREGILPVFVLLKKWKHQLRSDDREHLLDYSSLEHICQLMQPHVGIVTLLLRHGADPNHRSYDGSTALHLVCNMDYRPLLEDLPEFRDEYETLRVSLVESVQKEVELLLRAGADVNAGDRDGRTPVHLALRNPANRFLAEQLLENRADVNARDKTLWTCLDYAIEEGDVAALELLLEHGARVYERPPLFVRSGLTPMQKVVYQPRDEKLRARMLEAILEQDLESGWRSGFLDFWNHIDWRMNGNLDAFLRYVVLAMPRATEYAMENSGDGVGDTVGEKCKLFEEQAQMMRRDNLQGAVTVMDFLVKRRAKLSQIVGNENVIEALLERIDSGKYDLYKDLLYRRLDKARKWTGVMHSAEQMLGRLCDCRLPQLVHRHILEYLSDEDLLCLKRLHLVM